MNIAGNLGASANPLELDQPTVHHIPEWGGYEDPKRMDIISRIARMRGRDPRIATLAVNILKQSGVQPRDYEGQSAALLKWVQDNLYYVNEPDERLQDPLYTLKVGYGDCDDLSIMLGALLESIRMPWKLTISGTTRTGRKLRYHEGDKNYPKRVKWSHIYLCIGDQPFSPKRWEYAEPTVRGAPLGWDVVRNGAEMMPEMNYGGIMFKQFRKNYGASGPGPQGGFAPGGGPGSMLRATATPKTRGGIPQHTFTPRQVATPSLTTGLTGSPSFGPSITTGTPSLTGTPSITAPPLIGGGLPTLDIPAIITSTVPSAPGITPIYPGTGGGAGSGAGGGGGVGTAGLRAHKTTIMAVRPDGRVLLEKRSRGVEPWPKKYDFPARKVSVNEPLLPQAVQVFKAEAGIEISPRRFNHLWIAHHPGAGQVAAWVVFLTPAEVQAIGVNKPEHVSHRWLSLRQIRAYGSKVVPYVHFSAMQFRKRLAGIAAGSPPFVKLPRLLPFSPAAQERIRVRSEYSGVAEMAKEPMMGIPLWIWALGTAAVYYYYQREGQRVAGWKRDFPSYRDRPWVSAYPPPSKFQIAQRRREAMDAAEWERVRERKGKGSKMKRRR